MREFRDYISLENNRNGGQGITRLYNLASETVPYQEGATGALARL